MDRSETLSKIARQILGASSVEVFLDLGLGAASGSGLDLVRRSDSGVERVGGFSRSGRETNSTGARAEIRQFLARAYPEEFSGPSSIHDLSSRPVGKSKLFSISHCPGAFGVLVADLSEGSFGLDLESVSRVSELIARRVSLPTEMETTPSFAHLWVAKESFYKALPPDQQSTTISRLLIRDWVDCSDELAGAGAGAGAGSGAGLGAWEFRAQALDGSASGLGVVTLVNESLIFAASRLV